MDLIVRNKLQEVRKLFKCVLNDPKQRFSEFSHCSFNLKQPSRYQWSFKGAMNSNRKRSDRAFSPIAHNLARVLILLCAD